MTETEWLACDDPVPMLEFCESNASERKVRLFHVACCERVEHLFIDAQSHSALASARRYADGQPSNKEWQVASVRARAGWGAAIIRAGAARYGEEFERMTRMMSSGTDLLDELLGFDPATNAAAAVFTAVDAPRQAGHERTARYASHAIELESGSDAVGRERQLQSSLLRCIFGNPFRPVTFSPTWRTSTAVALASQMYESREFSAMPILADALQDAGCDSADVLDHCRGDGPHVRGCWVVDLVLGKE